MFSSFESLAVTPRWASRFRGSACRLQTPIRLTLFAVLLLAGHLELSAADSPPMNQLADRAEVSDALPTREDSPDQSRTPIRRATDADPPHPARVRQGSLGGSLALLGLVLASAYFVLLWLKRRQFGQHASPPAAIDVIASRRLDGHSTLHLVRIGRRVLAIGSSPTSLRTLAVVEDPEEIALLVAPPRGETRADPSRGWSPFRTRPVPSGVTDDRSGPTSASPPLLAELDRPGRIA